MSVNVHSNLTESPREIAGVLDYAIKNWNVDKEKIVGVGNSMGTLIISELLRQRSDLVDFIKTSTGKTPVSATVGAANIILETIRDSGRDVGFKASGGIREFEEARKYLILSEVILGADWPDPAHFRIGASSLLDDLIRVIENKD